MKRIFAAVILAAMLTVLAANVWAQTTASYSVEPATPYSMDSNSPHMWKHITGDVVGFSCIHENNGDQCYILVKH
jgi:hypothetical protein